MNIDEYVATIDYDLETKAPSQWTLAWWALPNTTVINITSTEKGRTNARVWYEPNILRFEGSSRVEYERKGTQEESQLSVGLLFVVVFFFIAFYLSKK